MNPPENKTIEFIYTHTDSNKNKTATYSVQRLPDNNGDKQYQIGSFGLSLSYVIWLKFFLDGNINRCLENSKMGLFTII